MSIYEACPECKPARDEGRFDDLNTRPCHTCKGKGYRRTRESWICNACGGLMCPNAPEGSGNRDIPHGLVEAEVMGGYDSEHLSDCTGYRFSLCEKCLRTMFNGFKIPPSIRHYSLGVLGDTGTESAYADDRDWYDFTRWRDSGGQKAKLATGICNYREWCTKPAEWRHFVSGHITHEAYCTEHKAAGTYGNSDFVPVSEVEGVPMEPEARSFADQEKIANAFLKVAIERTDFATHMRYVPSCLRDLLDLEQDKTGALFLPRGLPKPAWAAPLSFRLFPTGTLYYGPADQLHMLAMREYNRTVYPERLLRGLPEESDGDE